VKKYWQDFSERERETVIAGVLIVVIYIFYAWGYSPLRTSLSKNLEALQEKKATLQWLESVKPFASKISRKESLTNSQLLTLLSDELKTNISRDFPYQLQQTGSGEIQLSFEQVPFEYLISWLTSFQKKHSITIKQVNVEKLPTSGLIKVLLVIVAK
jgi:general secretion pathway protein M